MVVPSSDDDIFADGLTPNAEVLEALSGFAVEKAREALIADHAQAVAFFNDQLMTDDGWTTVADLIEAQDFLTGDSSPLAEKAMFLMTPLTAEGVPLDPASMKVKFVTSAVGEKLFELLTLSITDQETVGIVHPGVLQDRENSPSGYVYDIEADPLKWLATLSTEQSPGSGAPSPGSDLPDRSSGGTNLATQGLSAYLTNLRDRIAAIKGDEDRIPNSTIRAELEELGANSLLKKIPSDFWTEYNPESSYQLAFFIATCGLINVRENALAALMERRKIIDYEKAEHIYGMTLHSATEITPGRGRQGDTKRITQLNFDTFDAILASFT